MSLIQVLFLAWGLVAAVTLTFAWINYALTRATGYDDLGPLQTWFVWVGLLAPIAIPTLLIWGLGWLIYHTIRPPKETP